MLFDLELIKSITLGAEEIIYEDGNFKFFRFTEEEAKTTDNINVFNTAGVQMLFKTDGTVLNLSIQTKSSSDIRSLFAFDIFVDGELIGDIKNYKESECVGNFAEKNYLLGEFEGSFDLGTGEKTVRIVFPYSCIGEIKKIEIENATFALPVKRKKVIIAYGDSITQGYDAQHPSRTYTSKVSDAFDAELFNKGLGGEQFSSKLSTVKNNKNADFLIVSYGSNDWSASKKEQIEKNAEAFFAGINENYGDIPVFAISPIWRKEYKEIRTGGDFLGVEKIIRTVCEKYSNVTVISGFDLVLPEEKYFADLRVHPNDDGFELFTENLLIKMKSEGDE